MAEHLCVPDKPHDLCSVEIGAVHVTFCGLLFSPQQSCTTVVPGSDLNPAGQAWHAADPVAFWNVSRGHVKHDLLATASWYCPDGHSAHDAEPDTFLKVPTAHATHGPVLSGPVKPGLHWCTREVALNVELFGMHGPPRGPLHHASHMQSVMFWLPADEFEFSGQRVQFAVPLESLYVPGRQALHWPFESPVSGPV